MITLIILSILALCFVKWLYDWIKSINSVEEFVKKL